MTAFCSEVSQLQSAVRSGLVRHDDVRFPLEWYVEKRICWHKKLLLAYMPRTPPSSRSNSSSRLMPGGDVLLTKQRRHTVARESRSGRSTAVQETVVHPASAGARNAEFDTENHPALEVIERQARIA